MSKSRTFSRALSFLGLPALLLSLATSGLAQDFWPGAIIAQGQIDFNGQNIMTDSFDSSNPWKSLYGQYDPAVAEDNAV